MQIQKTYLQLFCLLIKKAFDRVNYSFLLKTLKQLNFGPAFLSWIETILTNIKSQVKKLMAF